MVFFFLSLAPTVRCFPVIYDFLQIKIYAKVRIICFLGYQGTDKKMLNKIYCPEGIFIPKPEIPSLSACCYTQNLYFDLTLEQHFLLLFLYTPSSIHRDAVNVQYESTKCIAQRFDRRWITYQKGSAKKKKKTFYINYRIPTCFNLAKLLKWCYR